MKFVGTANEEGRDKCKTRWFDEEETCSKGDSSFKVAGEDAIFFVKEECDKVDKEECGKVVKEECGKGQEGGWGDSLLSVEREFVSNIKFEGEGAIFFVKEECGRAQAGG